MKGKEVISTKKLMLHEEYVRLGELSELKSVKQVREAIDKRQREILNQLKNENNQH